MEIQAGPLDWTQFDAEKLAAFLDTETGKRLIPKLVETAPALLESGETNLILIRSGTVLGYQKVVQELLHLAHPIPVSKDPVNEYPDLTNDQAWNDGQKLEPEPKE